MEESKTEEVSEIQQKVGRPKRTLKKSVRLEPPGSVEKKTKKRGRPKKLAKQNTITETSEPVAKKIKKEKEVADDFNPWSVEDVSVFLKYCCPECKFSDHTLKGFTEHALENHAKAKTFFTAENIAEQLRLDRIIKTEEPEIFEYENYDLEQPDPFPDQHDDFIDQGESKNEHTLPPSKLVRKKVVPKKRWYHSIESTEENFTCKQCKDSVFETKLEATKHFMEEHLAEKAEAEKGKFEACQICVTIHQAGIGELTRHYSIVHPGVERHFYDCKICTEYTPTHSFKQIVEHNQKDHPEKKNLLPYQCISCDESFHFYEEILLHEKNVHKIDHIVNKCPSCPQTFLSEQLLTLHKHSHEKKEKPAPLWCSLCEFTCDEQIDLESHKEKEHPTLEKPKILCEICVVEFSSKELLDKHKSDQHKTCKFCVLNTGYGISWNKLLYHTDLRHGEEQGYEKKHFCPKCNKGFAFESSKMIHLRENHKPVVEKPILVCETCGKNFNGNSSGRQKMKEHMLMIHNFEGKTKLVCEKCGYSTISKEKMRDHARKKHEIEKHKKCPYCEYSNYRMRRILIHIDNKHPETGEKQFQCEKCQATFIYEQSFINHRSFKCRFSDNVKRSKENKMKLSITCDYCEEVFTSDHWAKHHYKSKHPGKPIIGKQFDKHFCNLCNEFFFIKESLDCHLNLEHGVKTDKNFCKHCKASYTSVHNCSSYGFKKLDPTKKEAFVCAHCNPPKSFASKQHLNEHISVQHEGKRYACSECDKNYTTIRHLKSHIQTVHLKRGDFKCKFCGKKFATIDRHRNHVRQSHTQVNCEICFKQINNQFELKKHKVLVHNDTKNAWICEICPKRVFFTQTMFQKHIEAKH